MQCRTLEAWRLLLRAVLPPTAIGKDFRDGSIGAADLAPGLRPGA